MMGLLFALVLNRGVFCFYEGYRSMDGPLVPVYPVCLVDSIQLDLIIMPFNTILIEANKQNQRPA